MADQRRAVRRSAVRPDDRPSRRPRQPNRSTSKAQTKATTVSAPRGSVLNPGFPKRMIAVLAVIVVLLAGAWVVLGSSWLGVREVRVEGNQVLSVEEVRAAVALGPGDALLLVDTEEVADRLTELPAVAHAQVERSWPAALVVTITERSPVATVQSGGEPWLIDIEGVVYVPAERIGEEAQELLALQVDDPSPDDLATTQAVEVIAGLDAATRDMVAEVTAPSAAQITLVLHDGREVIWGDSSRMNDKITMLPAVLDHEGEIFDISSPSAIVIK